MASLAPLLLLHAACLSLESHTPQKLAAHLPMHAHLPCLLFDKFQGSPVGPSPFSQSSLAASGGWRAMVLPGFTFVSHLAFLEGAPPHPNCPSQWTATWKGPAGAVSPASQPPVHLWECLKPPGSAAVEEISRDRGLHGVCTWCSTPAAHQLQVNRCGCCPQWSQV